MNARILRRSLVSGLVLAVSAVGTVLTVPAQAESAATTFSCGTPLGAKDMISQSDTDFPEVMYVGDAPRSATYTGKVTVPADLMSTAYDFLGARSVEGYSDQTITVNGVARTFRVTAPNTQIVKGQPLIMNGVGDFGTITPPDTPTLLTIKAGTTYQSHMVIRKGDGSVASESDSTCTAKPGAGNTGVIDTIRVMARSTTAVTLATSTVAEGEPVEVSSEVSVTGGTAVGSVKFSAADQSVTVPVSGGQAQGLLPALPAGTHEVTAQFLPSDAQLYEGSTSEPAPLSVVSAADAVPTATVLEVTPGSAEVGTPVIFTATVTAESGTPVGSVRFQAGGKTYTAPVVDGVASTTASNLVVGTHTVTAAFVPTRAIDFRASNAESRSLTITPKPAGPGSPTITTVPEFAGAFTYGRLVSVTAYVVAENNASPTGTVRFQVAGHVREVPVSQGRATASLPSLPVGDYEVTSQFIPANESFEASEGAPRTLRIVPAEVPTRTKTSVTLKLPAKARYLTIVSLSATVSGQGAKGSVRFTVGTVSRAVAVRNGVATVVMPSLQLGKHAVVARFTPLDASAFTNSSKSGFLTVVKAPTTTKATLKRAAATKLVAGVTVTTASKGNRCNTKVTVVLSKAGSTIASKVARLSCQGKATVAFVSAKVKDRASYRVVVRYAGTAGLAKSTRTLNKTV